MKTNKPNKIDLLACYKRIRAIWTINPRTMVKKSKKIYDRAKEKQKFKKELRNE